MHHRPRECASIIIACIIDQGSVLASLSHISVAYFLARALRCPFQISPTMSCLMHFSQPDDDADDDSVADDDDGESCLMYDKSSL